MTTTRRQFVGGTAVAAGAAAFGAMQVAPAMAGIATDESAEWLGAAPEVDEDQIVETVETEVVVVGAGNAGGACACRVAQGGGDVVLIDAAASSMNGRNFLGAVGTRWQEETGYTIDRNDIVCDLVRYSSGWAKQGLINLWADNSAEMLDWYDGLLEEQGQGIMLEYGMPETRYPTWPTNHFPMAVRGEKGQVTSSLQLILDKAAECGADVRYNTSLVKAESDGERVTGIIATNEDGDYIRINASKGVVLATGGYAGNEEMLDALQPWLKGIVGSKMATGLNLGAGIKAGLWLGAARQAHPSAMLFDRATLPVDFKNGDSYDNGIWSGYSQPALRVNVFGERFSNESMPYDFNSHAAGANGDGTWFQIFDANFVEDVKSYDTMGCSRLVPGPGTGFSADGNTDDSLEGTKSTIENMVEEGLIQQADTIEELAEKLNLPVDALVATVDRYNELADNGYDEDFGKEASRLRPVREAPFYGGHVSSWLLCTLDGLTINEDFQVLTPDNEPIEGLYAIGNDAGDYFVGNYPELIVGAAVGRSLTFGYLLGNAFTA
jgi:hypothetical protein